MSGPSITTISQSDWLILEFNNLIALQLLSIRLSRSNFCDTFDYSNCNDPYHAVFSRERDLIDSPELLFEHIIYLNCTHQVTENHKYVNTVPCLNWNSKGYYIYAVAGDLIAQDFQVGCHVKLVTPTSLLGLQRNKLLSYDMIHKALVYGFEISWMHLSCHNRCGDLAACSVSPTTNGILECIPRCRPSTGYWSDFCGKGKI